ncbi:hypothetical protein A471_14216, partial [Ectopseudomonas mendocina DLHK]
MYPIDDPFGGPPGNGGGGSGPGNDRTMIMPRPGGRAPEPPAGQPRPAPAAGPAPAMPGAPLPSSLAQGLNPLERAAAPLLALLTRLRNT